MAKKIFNTHVKDKSGLDPKSCGCEWWVQVRPSEGKRINSNSSEAKNGIQFHWDKDETLRDIGGGVFIHPHLFTVTYLTDEGAPTMVFHDSAPDEGLLSRKIQEAFISFPKVGKHLSFDGRFLHGAPSDLSTYSLDKLRITFLVNIWLHHKPLGIETFPSSMLHTLSNRVIKDIHVSEGNVCKSLSAFSARRKEFTWGLSELVNISISLPLSLQDKNILENSYGNVRIHDPHGVAYLNTIDNNWNCNTHLNKASNQGPKSIQMKMKMQNLFHSLFPTKEQLNDLKLRNRMRLASFSVFLIWICSLKTATYLATYSIEVPPIEMLYRSCHATYEVVQDEREKFTQCAKTQLNQCEASLSKMAQNEYSRVDEASKQNSETNAAIAKVAEMCLQDYDGLTDILKQWSNAGNEVPLMRNVCTEEEKKLLLNSIVSVDSLKSKAFQVSENYRRESEAVVTDLIEYTKIRMDYDRRYIMSNTDLVEGFFETNLPRPRIDFTSQIEQARNSFQAWTDCMNIATDKSCSLEVPTDLIVQFHNEVHQRGEEYINAMQAHYTRSYDRIVALHNNIVDKATNIYNFFKAGKKFMEWIMDNDSKAANDYELFREPFKSFVLDKFGDMVDQLKSFETNRNISDVLSEALSRVYEDEIKERAGNAYNVLNGEITSGFNNFQAEFTSWLDSVQSNFDFDKLDFFVDYDPPTYKGVNQALTNLDEEKASFQKNGEEFISRSSEALHKIANTTATSIRNSNQTRKKWSRANYTSFKSGLQNKSLNLLKPSKPKFSIDDMFLKALSMRDILFLVDFGFRIYFSIRLFFKYWSVSSIKLPEIDVRTKKDYHTMNPLRWSYGKIVFTVIVNPITGMLLGLVLVTLIIRFASDIVFPLVADYEKGCVANAVQGTFLSANLYSFAYNFAYNDGSSILVDGLKNLETRRTNLCFDNVSPSVTKYNDDMSYFNQTMLMVSTLGRQFDKYSECVDTNTFDNQILTACCKNIDFVDDEIHSCRETLNQSMTCPIDFDYSAFTPPGEYVARHSCNIDKSNEYYAIRNSVYDCTALRNCDVTCSGPHKEKIKQFSKQCSCVSEWTFHSFWLRTILALLIFVIMNTSRKIIVDGLALLFWKHLHPGTFTVCFTCNSDGTIRTTGTVKSWKGRHSISSVESSREIKEGTEALILTDEIKRQILWNSFKFQMTGILLIVGALSMNALWIGVALRVNDNLRLHWL